MRPSILSVSASVKEEEIHRDGALVFVVCSGVVNYFGSVDFLGLPLVLGALFLTAIVLDLCFSPNTIRSSLSSLSSLIHSRSSLIRLINSRSSLIYNRSFLIRLINSRSSLIYNKSFFSWLIYGRSSIIALAK
ncbi:Uncharacterized protein Rs2_02928 [Raphanus sativus]|nr:Uncharacterized protein Rs2_02928 [Raphanus sativus]